jgi:tetratricopeptide (TPR) repeat protein
MYVRDRDPDGLRSELADRGGDLAQLVPELRTHLPDLPNPPELDPELARFRMFDSVTEFLRSASEHQPLVVVLDDMHAADAPSLLLLRFLARELAAMSALIIVAFRDVSPVPTPALDEMTAEVSRSLITLRLGLRGLSRRGVEDYLQLSRPALASSELGRRLHAQTDGNPLFVSEIVRLLAPSGAAASSDNGPESTIPQTIREVIERRLMLLSEECRSVLQQGAVMGREFSLRTLSMTCDASDDALLALLDEAGAERVISETPGELGQFRFDHVLIRDVIYERLGAARRVRLHRGVLGALEALHGADPGPHLAELAHHAIAAHDPGKGVAYARRAADHSLEQLAYEEAARLYQIALDAAEPTDRETRCELLLGLAEAQARAGETTAAQAAFLEAAGLARQLALPGALAQAAAGYGGRLAWARAGDDEQMVPLLEEGLSALGDRDIGLRARLLARLAGALRDEPLRERRDSLSEEAVKLARRSGNLPTLAYALDGRAAAIVAHDTAEELLRIGDELRQTALRAADPERVVAGHIWRFHAQLFLGEIDGATSDLGSAARLATELGQPVQLWLVCANRSMLSLAVGRLGEARELIETSLELGMRAQPHGAIPIYWFQRLTLGDFVGELDELRPAFRDLIARYPARVMFRCAAAYLDARLGHQSAARRALKTLAAHSFSGLPIDQEWLYGASFLAEVASAAGDDAAVADLYTLLLPWAGLNAVDVSEGMRGSVARYLALLAGALGRLDDAVGHFEQAIEANERMGALPWLAHTQRDYAQLLLARNQPGDRSRGRELINDALTTYRQLEMGSAAEQAQGLRP